MSGKIVLSHLLPADILFALRSSLYIRKFEEMTDQDPGHANPSAQASVAAPAKERPEPAATVQEANNSTQAPKSQPRTYRIELENIDSKKPPGTWQRVRENIKDVLLPLAALAVTAITWYFGNQLNQRDLAAKTAESRNKLLTEFTSEDPRERKRAAMFLAEQGKDALPTLYFALETDDKDFQASACDALKGVVRAGDTHARANILARLLNDIKDGDRVQFRGGAICAAQKTFFRDVEVRSLLDAIETRLGIDGRFCQQNPASKIDQDDPGVQSAVQAEYSFPSATSHAPDFLIGIIQNCPEEEFTAAQEAAINHLPVVFKAAFHDDCNKKLDERLDLLLRTVSKTMHERIKADIVSPPCQ